MADKTESLDQKVITVENLLRVSLVKVRELKKGLKDPRVLKAEMKRGIPEFDSKLNDVLQGYVDAMDSQD